MTGDFPEHVVRLSLQALRPFRWQINAPELPQFIGMEFQLSANAEKFFHSVIALLLISRACDCLRETAMPARCTIARFS
jgi:hypothetical protein